MTRVPPDAEARRAVPPVICYPNETLPQPDMALYRGALAGALPMASVMAAPRDACHFRVSAGQFFRIRSVETAISTIKLAVQTALTPPMGPVTPILGDPRTSPKSLFEYLDLAPPQHEPCCFVILNDVLQQHSSL